MKNQKGFSLIELLIVVVIIGIIAAIAIPNLLAARRSANEGSAVASLRTMHGAQATYASQAGNGNFGTPVQLAASQLIDSQLGSATPQKSGYDFTHANAARTTTTAASFGIVADPVVDSGVTQTGTRSFAIGTDGVLYTGAPAALTVSTSGATGTSTVLSN